MTTKTQSLYFMLWLRYWGIFSEYAGYNVTTYKMYMYIGTVYESAVLNCRTLYCRVYPLSTRADTITCARHDCILRFMAERKSGRCPYKFHPYCLGHIKICDSFFFLLIAAPIFSLLRGISYMYPTSADVYGICRIAYIYMCRAAVHNLDAEFTFLKWRSRIPFSALMGRVVSLATV